MYERADYWAGSCPGWYQGEYQEVDQVSGLGSWYLGSAYGPTTGLRLLLGPEQIIDLAALLPIVDNIYTTQHHGPTRQEFIINKSHSQSLFSCDYKRCIEHFCSSAGTTTEFMHAHIFWTCILHIALTCSKLIENCWQTSNVYEFKSLLYFLWAVIMRTLSWVVFISQISYICSNVETHALLDLEDGGWVEHTMWRLFISIPRRHPHNEPNEAVTDATLATNKSNR